MSSFSNSTFQINSDKEYELSGAKISEDLENLDWIKPYTKIKDVMTKKFKTINSDALAII